MLILQGTKGYLKQYDLTFKLIKCLFIHLFLSMFIALVNTTKWHWHSLVWPQFSDTILPSNGPRRSLLAVSGNTGMNTTRSVLNNYGSYLGRIVRTQYFYKLDTKQFELHCLGKVLLYNNMSEFHLILADYPIFSTLHVQILSLSGQYTKCILQPHRNTCPIWHVEMHQNVINTLASRRPDPAERRSTSSAMIKFHVVSFISIKFIVHWKISSDEQTVKTTYLDRLSIRILGDEDDMEKSLLLW